MIDIKHMQDSFLINLAIKYYVNNESLDMQIPNLTFKNLDGHHLFESSPNKKTLNFISNNIGFTEDNYLRTVLSEKQAREKSCKMILRYH